MKPTIVVTGATCSTGLQVVGQPLARDWPVRALVRQVDARAERLRSLGAQVVVANLFDAGQVVTALRGAQRPTSARRPIRTCSTAPGFSPWLCNKRSWTRWWC